MRLMHCGPHAGLALVVLALLGTLRALVLALVAGLVLTRGQVHTGISSSFSRRGLRLT